MADSTSSKTRLRTLKLVAVNLAVTLVLVELAAVVAYYLRTGTLYYTHDSQRPPLVESLESAVATYRLHPYLGFILEPAEGVAGGQDNEWTRNNYGFESNVNYPYSRRHTHHAIVGIFGGSAAAKLARFEAREGVLADRLADVTGGDPQRITVLNFAQGGFKQPQQLLIYNYFRSLGQEFDLVINFDGFNEVVLAGRNAAANIAVDMPSIEHMRALQDLTTRVSDYDGVERLESVRSSWSRFVHWHNRAWLRQGWETTFAAGFTFDWLAGKYHERRYHNARQSYSRAATDGGTSWLYLNRARADDSASETLGRIISLWSHSSVLMHRAAAADGTSYLHIVQPNQYHSTARVFDEAERRIAFSSESPYPPLVESGYPLLELELPRLREQGVPVYGLFRIFDSVPQAVYADDCCHYTDEGQRILLERIGELAAPLLAGDPATR